MRRVNIFVCGGQGRLAGVACVSRAMQVLICTPYRGRTHSGSLLSRTLTHSRARTLNYHYYGAGTHSLTLIGAIASLNSRRKLAGCDEKTRDAELALEPRLFAPLSEQREQHLDLQRRSKRPPRCNLIASCVISLGGKIESLLSSGRLR